MRVGEVAPGSASGPRGTRGTTEMTSTDSTPLGSKLDVRSCRACPAPVDPSVAKRMRKPTIATSPLLVRAGSSGHHERRARGRLADGTRDASENHARKAAQAAGPGHDQVDLVPSGGGEDLALRVAVPDRGRRGPPGGLQYLDRPLDHLGGP